MSVNLVITIHTFVSIFIFFYCLTLSCRRPLSYRNQFIDLRSKHLYHYEKVKVVLRRLKSCPLRVHVYHNNIRALSLERCSVVVELSLTGKRFYAATFCFFVIDKLFINCSFVTFVLVTLLRPDQSLDKVIKFHKKNHVFFYQ